MKIAILGAGAMGMLFGARLSRKNEVWLLDPKQERVDAINREGVVVEEAEGPETGFPRAAADSAGLGEMELVIVFVKSTRTEEALLQHRALIGKDTWLLTLQNGCGHEEKLRPYAGEGRVVIGTTQHNSSVSGLNRVRHGGGGKTSIGLPSGDGAALTAVAETFTACGFPCTVSQDVKRQIWQKLFLNSAASSLTAILQCPMGFLVDSPEAFSLVEGLAREAVAVANADTGGGFDAAAVIEEIRGVLERGRGGYTSIYADVKKGARSEVDTIAGAVAAAGHRLGVPVPKHEAVAALIHAMERKYRDGVE